MDYDFRSLLEVPVGYRFVPTDEELVTHYLMNKIHYRPLPAQVIRDLDAAVFRSEPPKNLDAVRFTNGEREWYFFTHEEIIEQNNEKGMRIKVGDGLGFWKAMGREEPICNSDGNVFAFKFHFTYFSGGFSNPKKTHWKMDLYTLSTHHPSCSQSPNFQGEEWILLRIRRGMEYKSYL